MLYLFGNCQTGFLTQALVGRGIAARHFSLASPLTRLRSPGRVPPELSERIASHDLAPYLHERSLENQFLTLSPGEPAPEAAIFSLFHENIPLFSHMEDGYVLYIDPASWEASPAFETWMKERFQVIRPGPLSYPERFAALVEDFRARYPDTPLYLLGKLSHFQAFGPNPYTYLECWEDIYGQAGEAMREFAARLGRCVYVDLDKTFAGVWARKERRIEAHCPFIRFRPVTAGEDQGGNKEVPLTPRRDLEHIGSMWAALAAALERHFATGELEYGDGGGLPESWNEPYVPESLDPARIAALLSTGGNYDAARAVWQFFLNPGLDGPAFLAEARHAVPVCHNLLHMLKIYAALRPDRRLIRFLRANAQKAAVFDQNGPAFKAAYRGRLQEMEAAILAATS